MDAETKAMISLAGKAGSGLTFLGATATSYFNTEAFQGVEGALGAILVGTGTKLGFDVGAIGGGLVGLVFLGAAGALISDQHRKAGAVAGTILGGISGGVTGINQGYDMSRNMVVNGVANYETEAPAQEETATLPLYTIDAPT